MTNVPDPIHSPINADEPVVGDAAPGDAVIDSAAALLDEGTFTAIKEPRGRARLELDGTWHQISPKYVTVQLIVSGLLLLAVIAAGVAVFLFADSPFAYIPVGIVAALLIGTVIITPRQARAIGYMLRADDLVFRKGILWQRMVAVPYGRLQLVDITHGPLDRAFGIAQLKLVTAAAATGVSIPGLAQPAAELLRDTLVEVAETRRTGL